MTTGQGDHSSAEPARRWVRSGRVELDELAARRGVRPVTQLQDMAMPDLFDTDEDLAALQAQVRAWRDADIA